MDVVPIVRVVGVVILLPSRQAADDTKDHGVAPEVGPIS